MIRETDANETSGEDGWALLGSLVGESQLRTPKFEPEIMLSNMLPPSLMVCVIVIRWSREGRFPPAQELVGGMLLLLFAMIRSVVKSFKVPDVEVAAARMSNESALTRSD